MKLNKMTRTNKSGAGMCLCFRLSCLFGDVVCWVFLFFYLGVFWGGGGSLLPGTVLPAVVVVLLSVKGNGLVASICRHREQDMFTV